MVLQGNKGYLEILYSHSYPQNPYNKQVFLKPIPFPIPILLNQTPRECIESNTWSLSPAF